MSPFFRKISDGARSLRKGQLLENGRFTRSHRTVCIRIASGSGDTHYAVVETKLEKTSVTNDVGIYVVPFTRVPHRTDRATGL